MEIKNKDLLCSFCSDDFSFDYKYTFKAYDSTAGWYLEYEADDPYYSAEMKIKYCPICGRELS